MFRVKIGIFKQERRSVLLKSIGEGEKRRVILYFAGSRASWRSQWHISGETWEAVSLETFFFLSLNDESQRSEKEGNRRRTKNVSKCIVCYECQTLILLNRNAGVFE